MIGVLAFLVLMLGFAVAESSSIARIDFYIPEQDNSSDIWGIIFWISVAIVLIVVGFAFYIWKRKSRSKKPAVKPSKKKAKKSKK